MCTTFRKLTVVCYERVHKKKKKFVGKKIIIDNYLLREKDIILNLLER